MYGQFVGLKCKRKSVRRALCGAELVRGGTKQVAKVCECVLHQHLLPVVYMARQNRVIYLFEHGACLRILECGG